MLVRMIIAATIVVAFAYPNSVRAAASDNVSGWAWAAEAGWLSANSENCTALNRATDPDPCTAGRPYGVTIADAGAMTGYLWSPAAGWVCIGATCAGSGGATPTGGWQARVNAVTGEVLGWGKALAFGEGGWVSFSCENTGTCGAVAYRTSVDVAGGRFSGYAWNGANDGGALGWISWRPAFGGVTTTWRPVPRCTVGGAACAADVECALPGELCCLGGAPCGRCGGEGEACGVTADCDAGILCCRAGVDCGRCTTTGAACGSDAQCGGGAGSCCPPGAVCAGAEDPGGGTSVPADPVGLCSGTGAACVGDTQCAGDQTCDTTTGSCTETGAACETFVGGGSSCLSGACATVGRCANASELCAVDANCPAGGACAPVRSCVADLTQRCVDDNGCAAAGGACVERPGRCTNTGAACRSDAECGEDGRCDASVGRCSASGTSCVADRECLENERCVSVGVCATSLDPCVDTSDCDTGARESCDRGIGLCTVNGPGDRPVPCRTDATCRALAPDAECRKQLGRCVETNQLCAVDANCPIVDPETGARDQCGKLFLPWIQTQFGSLYSRGDIGSSRTPPPPPGAVNATYCILAGGRIVNFSSASATCGPIPGYTLPAEPAYTPRITARLDTRGILAGRYGRTMSLPSPFPATLAGVYLVDGRTVTIGETIIERGAGLVIVRGGNLRITGDIRYAPQQVERARDLASVGWLILKGPNGEGGDVLIDPSVTEVVGAFYAEGTVRTGSTGSVTADLPLTIRGVLVAQRFLFERLAGSLGGGAERIIADGRALANTPPGFGDLVRALPIIRQTAP